MHKSTTLSVFTLLIDLVLTRRIAVDLVGYPAPLVLRMTLDNQHLTVYAGGIEVVYNP